MLEIQKDASAPLFQIEFSGAGRGLPFGLTVQPEIEVRIDVPARVQHHGGQNRPCQVRHDAVDRGHGHVVRPEDQREVQVSECKHRPRDQNRDGQPMAPLDRALHVAAERGFFHDAGDRSGHEQQGRHGDRRHLRQIRKLLVVAARPIDSPGGAQGPGRRCRARRREEPTPRRGPETRLARRLVRRSSAVDSGGPAPFRYRQKNHRYTAVSGTAHGTLG